MEGGHMTEPRRFVIGFPVSLERQVEIRSDWPLTPAEWNRMWTLLEDMRVDLVEPFDWHDRLSPATEPPAVETVEQQANDSAAGLPPRPEPQPEPEGDGDALEAAVLAPKRENRRQAKKDDES
jgi:hypothetical protein